MNSLHATEQLLLLLQPCVQGFFSPGDANALHECCIATSIRAIPSNSQWELTTNFPQGQCIQATLNNRFFDSYKFNVCMVLVLINAMQCA